MTDKHYALLLGKQGFTLVEIMVTLAVMAIIAALASPAIMEMAPNMRLRSAANELHANLMQAKSTAVKENRNIAFTVTTVDCAVANFLTNFPQNGGAYQIFIDDGAGVPANARNNTLDAGETVLITVNDAPGGNDDLPESVALCNQNFTPPAPALTGSLGFTATGLLQNAAGGNVILISTKGDRYQITLSPAGSVAMAKL